MRKRIAVCLLAAAIIVGLVVARGHEILRYAIPAGAALAGYQVQIAGLEVRNGVAEFSGVSVERVDEPLLAANRIAISYSLRDLLPGSRHRYGITGIDLSGVKLTLTRFKDGNFNLAIPSGSSGPQPPQRVDEVPLNFSVRVRDAQLELREPTAFDASGKYLRVDRIRADATVNTAAVTQYRITGAFAERRQEPFLVRGKIDAIAGYAMHRATAPRFPLRALANYFAQTPDVRVLRGGARNLDALAYALDVKPNVAPAYHVSLGLDIQNGRLALTTLAVPVEVAACRVHVVDNAFFVSGVRASLAKIPLQIRGGVYDLTGGVTGVAQLRLAVWGSGDLADLREAFGFTRDQPISGHATLGVSVQGPVTDPVIIARASAARAVYRRLPFDNVVAGVIYHANVVAFAPLQAQYGGIAIAIRGRLVTGPHLQSELAVHVSGPASRLPYLDEMLGDEPMVIDASARGTDLRFHVIWSAASARGVDRVAAMLQMDGDGTALVDPFWLHTPRGSLTGGYLLDRPHDSSAFWIAADGLHMRAPRYAAFPNLALPEMPKIDGGTLGAALAGGGSGRHIVLAGRVKAANMTIAGVPFNAIDATLAGTMAQTPINVFHAAGPWGTFDGHAGLSQRFVAVGAYNGSFERLAPFIGNTVQGHGPIAGNVAIAVEPQRIVVLGSDLRMPGATLRSVPVDRASLTLAIEGDRLRIYSAHAHAAGGDVVAAGTLALTPAAQARGPNTLSIVANRLQSSQLHGIGLPLVGGTIWATGDLHGGTTVPAFRGGVSVDRSRIADFPLSGEGDVDLANDSVALNRMVGALGGTYARVDGSIGSLSSGAPAYALRADVPAAQIARTLHAFHLPNYLTDGSFNAQLQIAGRAAAPSVSGAIGVPAGEVNGLPFIDASAILAADPTGVTMHAGSVLVGTTRARFSAAARPHEQAVDVDAPRADLSDFNNFFDTGDTLDGNGRVRIAAASESSHVTSSGDIDVRGFRYRNLPIGDTRAVWTSARNVVRGTVAVGGKEGMLHAHGSIALAPGAQWLSTLERSRFDLDADVDDLDLWLWLPALGMQSIPVTGRVSGEATVRGRFPQLDVRGNARLIGGTLGPLTLETAAVTLHAAGKRVAVDRAELTTPEISAIASGTFGLDPALPLDLHVHASTDRLAQLVYDVAKYRVPLSGSFESTLAVGGTYRAPTLLAGFDATGVHAYGIPIDSLFGEMRLRGKELVLSDAGATFAKGQVTLAGSLPLGVAPLHVLSASQPLSFDVDIVGVDPSIFNDAFGNNTKLTGVIDAHFGLAGTIRQPQIVGRVALANGSYVSDLERVPITQTVASISFNHGSASIDRVFARAGSGTLQLSGTAALPVGANAGIAFALRGNARRAVLDLPAYGSGTLDAALALAKQPAGMAKLSGNVTLSNASLPFASFVRAATQSATVGGEPIPLAFDISATAGNNVRVRGSGYGAGLDIGARGSVQLAGTLAAPTLEGSIASTGGTLTYFDRAFRVQQGSVRFNAADGVLPTLHAVANTSVVNPDPDRARNPYGNAEITINVDGPIKDLKIGLQSNPSGYDRDQILAMIAPFGGFLSGISFSRQGMLARQLPNGITPLGMLSPVPTVSLPQNSSITVGQEAFNILNAQFTAGLLAPVETGLSQGLGLSSVNLTLGYYGNVGFTATRLLGKAVSAVYAVTFGLPQIQSFGLVVQSGPYTTATLNFFYQSGPTRLLELPGTQVGFGAGYLSGQPLIGTSGFGLTLQQYFW